MVGGGGLRVLEEIPMPEGRLNSGVILKAIEMAFDQDDGENQKGGGRDPDGEPHEGIDGEDVERKRRRRKGKMREARSGGRREDEEGRREQIEKRREERKIRLRRRISGGF